MNEIEAVVAEALNAMPADPRPSVLVNADRARAVLAALKAARIAVVELAEVQIDPEWGDKFWQVPSADYNYPGKLRIETGYRDGVPRISMTSIRTPMPLTEVDAYVSALLAAKAAAEASQ